MGTSDNGQYNNNPDFNQDSDGAITSDYQAGGSPDDFNSWDWKQIEAAIVGAAAVASSDTTAQSQAQQVSDPQSLYDAADTLLFVQQTLQMVSQAIDDQATALAGGDNAPWSGAAADAFTALMTSFSQQVKANADVLSGGTTGVDSVPNQVNTNGNQLATAINKIQAIDTWYAHQAALQGIKPMSNGLIPVSQDQQIVDLLNRDMRAVITNLSGNYQTTVDAVKPPDTSNPNDPTGIDGGGPGAGGVGDGPDTGPTDPYSAPSTDPYGGGTGLGPTSTPDPSAFPGGTGLGSGSDLGSGSPSDSGLGNAVAAPFTGGTGLGSGPGLGSGSGDGTGLPLNSLAAFPGGSGLGGGSGAGGDGADLPQPSPFPGDTGTGSGSPGTGSDTGPVSPFPGTTGTGDPGTTGDDLPANADVSPFPGDTGTGSGLPGTDGIGGDTGVPSPFPGDTGLGPGGGLGGDAGLGAGGGAASPFPGDTGLGSGGGAGGGLGGDAGLGAGGGAPSPFPGDTGLGSGGGLGGDAGLGAGGGAGLGGLGDATAPGNGLESSGPGVANFPDSLGTGGSVGQQGGGMPMMPPMGGGAGSGAGGGAGEPSDASGLLKAQPFPGDLGTGGLGTDGLGGDAATGGAGPGAPTGLTGLDGLEPAAFPGGTSLTSPATTGGSGGSPMMPPMSGGASGKDGTGDRSDASGLLSPQSFPGDVGVGSDGPATAGAPSGEGSLTGLDGEPSAFPSETASSAAGGSSPMMPPMSGGASSKDGTGDRSDASGLLSPQSFPGDVGVGSDGPVTGGVSAGVDGEPSAFPGETASAGGSSPMMPPMSGAASGKDGTGDRSDASGLLSPQSFPGDVGVGSDGPVTGGAPAGVDGEASAFPGETASAGGGSPMMPPMSGAASGKDGTGDRSDASGLVAAQAFPGDAGVGGDGSVTGGAPAVVGGEPGGSPMMPPMLGGASGKDGAGEWSEASGLLAAQVFPGGVGAGADGPAVPDSGTPAGAAGLASVVGAGLSSTGRADRDRADTAKTPTAQPGSDGLGEDRVAVVAAGGRAGDDTAAWEVAGASGVAAVAWLLRRRDSDDEPVEPGRYPIRTDADWTSDNARIATWRPNRDGTAPPTEPVELRSYMGANPEEPEPPVAEEPPAEPAERTAADLLARESAYWDVPGGSLPGVLD